MKDERIFLNLYVNNFTIIYIILYYIKT